MFTNKQLEEIEYNHLLIIDKIIKGNIEKLIESIKRTLNYIEYITVPIVISSLEDKAYNPFSEIFEKYVRDLLDKKLEKLGFTPTPLGYSSDVCVESKELIIHIDIKTANSDNLSDFKNTIPLGANQNTYPGLIDIIPDVESGRKKKLHDPAIMSWPNVPKSYQIGKDSKLTLAYGILLVYPSFRNVLKKIGEDYRKVRGFFQRKVEVNLKKKLEQIYDIKIINFKGYLKKKPKNSKKTKGEIISENLVRAWLMHDKMDLLEKELNITPEEKKKLKKFEEKMIMIQKEFTKKEILPISIIMISVPNGKLIPDYDGMVVSGKSWGGSIRYHYDDGKFKNLNNKPRVLFSFLDPSWKKEMSRVFDNIYYMDGDGEIKELTGKKKLNEF